ncbi:unnamed protein product [Durusdinium trenchii]|uniref:EF-hand domain-containing protein n=1 Tax=Durusdinium trenchii TaxID=1381693 RepID=A0ABP0SBF5_9DINO
MTNQPTDTRRSVSTPMARSSGWSWKNYERPGLMQDEIEEVKAAFDLFDVDGTQRINPKDLRACIQSLNLRRNQVVHHLLNDLERFGSKPLDFKGFLDIMTAKMGERDTKEESLGSSCQRRHWRR